MAAWRRQYDILFDLDKNNILVAFYHVPVRFCYSLGMTLPYIDGDCYWLGADNDAKLSSWDYYVPGALISILMSYDKNITGVYNTVVAKCLRRQ